MEVETAAETVIENKITSPEKTEEAVSTETKAKEETTKTSSEAKNNGVLSGVAEAASRTAKYQTCGVVVQFPEMFSMKRDGHFLKKFENAADIKMQKVAYIECESDEVAAELQTKLNGTTMNGKKVMTSRLDINEKNVLYLGGLKKETTDEMLKELLPGFEKIIREKYNSYILFSSETECRAARTKINKEGICSQRLHCEFDSKGKDRFKTPEERPAKKQKVDDEKPKEGEESVEAATEAGEGQEENQEAAVEDAAETNAEEDEGKEEDVKADEW